MSRSLKQVGWAAAIFTVAVLPFLSAIWHGIVNLDDYIYLAFHAELQRPFAWETWRIVFTDTTDGIWMPLTWASYMMDYALGGGTWSIFHLHSILLHGVNAVLLWVLLCLAGNRNRGTGTGEYRGTVRGLFAAAAALLWAVHPLRVESVAWIASRKDVLSMTWLLLALILWVKWRIGNGEQETGNGERQFESRNAYYFLSLLCFLAGAMAKPSVMCFPALCLALDWTVGALPRIHAPDFEKKAWRAAARYFLPVALAAGVAALAAYAQRAGGAMALSGQVPVWWKVLNAATAFGMYLKNTMWPFDLAAQCVSRWPALPRGWWFGAPVCAVVLCWMVRSVRIGGVHRRCLPGAVWFAIAVFPTLGIVGFGFHAFADRFTYIPAAGLSLALCAAVANIRGRWRGVCAWVLVTSLAVLAVASWRQTGFWRSDETLFARTLEVDGDGNACAHGSLGGWAFEFPHDLERCVAEFSKAKELDPRRIEDMFEYYVLALCELGRIDQALKETAWYRRWADQAMQGDSAFDENRRQIARSVHRIAQMACMVHDPSMRKGAAEELRGNGGFPENDPAWLYLRYRLQMLLGDATAAERAREALLEKGNRNGYFRFRFLERAGSDHR